MTEVVLRVGHPMSMQTAKGPVDVTARALTNEQLDAIIRDTELASLMAPRRQDTTIELQVGALTVVARVTRGDDGIAVTLTRAALPPPPPTAPPTEPPSEFEIDIEFEPGAENERALATEPPVQRSVASPRPAPLVRGASLAASPRPGPPPLELEMGIELDLSLDDMPDPVEGGVPPVPPAPILPARNPVERAGTPAIQRSDSLAGSDRRDRQDLLASSRVFQRVDLRDAGAPMPKPDHAESTNEASAWADIDLVPPSRKR